MKKLADIVDNMKETSDLWSIFISEYIKMSKDFK